MKKQTPLHLEGIYDNIYAGFGPRLASLLLDAIIFIPFGLIIQYINSQNMYSFYYTIIPNIILGLIFYVYLPKKYGGTPGKLIMGLKIIRLDGKPIGWQEAIMRHLVLFILNLLTLLILAFAILKADSGTFESMGWIKQTQYLQSFFPLLVLLTLWANNIWVWGELIILLTNPRKRAAHDYMANTVIVKSIYVNKIEKSMYPEFVAIEHEK